MENEIKNEAAIIDLEKSETDKAELGPGDLGAGGDMDAGDIEAMNADKSGPENIMQTGAENLSNVLRGTTANPIGSINPAHKYFWRGNDINGMEHVGSGDDASKCNVEAGLQGSATCHLRLNPDYVDPVITEAPEAPAPTPRELNAFYAAGHADGLRYFEDIKTLILAWATEQNLSGGLPDVEALPFVIYARYNP
jgi:hypothetical protein